MQSYDPPREIITIQEQIMPFSLIPDRIYSSIHSLSAKHLTAEGVKFVLVDLDNTLARYRQRLPGEELVGWKESLQRAGITVFLVSNSRKPARPSLFCEELGISFIGHAGKPKRGCFDQALARLDAQPEECVMVGDQIFTDILGANRAGIRSWLVMPVALDSLFRKLRYGIEGIFRAMCKDDRRQKAPVRSK